MALSADEVGRRIRAARELNGLDQTDLAALLVEQGLGKHDAGRLERGQLVMQAVHRGALAKALRVPEAWFVLTQNELLEGLQRAFISGVAMPFRALDTETVNAIVELIDARLEHVRGIGDLLDEELQRRGTTPPNGGSGDRPKPPTRRPAPKPKRATRQPRKSAGGSN